MLLPFVAGDSYGQSGAHYVPASGRYNHYVLFFHGLGANCEDCQSFVPLVLPEELKESCKVVLPNAPMRAVTMMGGMHTKAWTDVLGLGLEFADIYGPMDAFAVQYFGCILKELEANPDLRIVIGGFSLGAALAYHMLVKSPFKFAAALCFSGWTPCRGNNLLEEYSGVNADTPVFHGHGRQDTIVTYVPDIEKKLVDLGMTHVEHHLYDVGHTITDAEIRDAKKFVRGALR